MRGWESVLFILSVWWLEFEVVEIDMCNVCSGVDDLIADDAPYSPAPALPLYTP